jgi:hypothetical protein
MQAIQVTVDIAQISGFNGVMNATYLVFLNVHVGFKVR